MYKYFAHANTSSARDLDRPDDIRCKLISKTPSWLCLGIVPAPCGWFDEYESPIANRASNTSRDLVDSPSVVGAWIQMLTLSVGFLADCESAIGWFVAVAF
jgi:hypothetical protein